MPGANYPYTKLDANQVIRQSFDEVNDRLRVDAIVTASIGDIQIDGTGSSPSSIQITDGIDFLQIEPDGSINCNIELDAVDGDNVLIVGTEDGSFGGIQHVLKIGSDLNLRVKDEQLNNTLTLLNSKFVDGNDIGDVTINNTNLNPVPITNPNLDIPLSSLNTKLTSLDNKFNVNLSTVATENTLSILNSKFVDGNDIGDVTINNTNSNPIPINITNIDIDVRNLNASQDNILIAGTENGLPSGTIRYIVNNLRKQIAATHDRVQTITYADAGTKHERIVQIDYSSPSFPGVIARKIINYTLAGNNYIPTSISWSIV